MTKTIISGALTNEVTLTNAIYGNPVTIAAGATISVASGGALDGALPTAWTLVNQGVIESGNSYGVYLHGGGMVANQSGGTISGQYGVRIAGGAASLVTAGGITGTTDAVLLATGFADTLTVDPGAAFSGTVDGGNTIGATHTSTLELASAAAAGTLTGLGTMFIDFAQVTIDAGATWTLTGGNPGTGGTFTDAGTLINAGSLGSYVTLLAGAYLLNQATATIVGGVVGTGGASRVTNLGSISSSGSGVFLQSGGTVFNGSATDTTALISASGGGVVIEGGGTVDNDGTIMDSSFAGVFIAGGGTVINGSATNTSAVIASGNTGLQFQNSATVINYGTISGVGVFGVVMASGSVTNSGTILGGNGVAINGAGAVVNTGEISASSSLGFGVRLTGQGTVTNGSPSLATASIYSAYVGVLISNGFGTATNYGTIIGSAETGIDIQPTGLVINGSAADTSAVVTGGSIGVDLAAGGMIANDGTISGAGFAGIFTSAHANVTNGSSTVTSALITSDTTGAELNGNSTLVNYGTIQASGTAGRAGVTGVVASLTNFGTISGGFGIDLLNAGNVANYGAIFGNNTSASYAAISMEGGTLKNAGTIIGAGGQAVQFIDGNALLVVDPGASFGGGSVQAYASASNTLELASGASAGTLSGLGTQFIDFTQTTLDAGATWTLTGANTIAVGATLTELSGASLTDTGVLENDGTIVLDPSTLTVAGLTGTGSVRIGAGGTVEVQGTIAGGETLVFAGSGADLHLDNPGSVTGSVIDFAVGETIDLKGIDPASVGYADGRLSFDGGGFALSLANTGTVTVSASLDGADVTLLCFCANTLIGTPSGERPVQTLAVGDMVTTHRGAARRIVWVGTGKVLATRGRRNAATPVIVRKDALASGVPNHDLRVTKGHSLYLDNVLIPVEYLVNHRSIIWDDRAQEIKLYHIELETHDVLIANGAPAESYRDDGNRWLFHNANSGWALPPLPPCAPVLTGGPVVDAVWRRLLDRAGPRPGLPLTDDPDLHLMVDGQRVEGSHRSNGFFLFGLPQRPSEIRVVSRAGSPAELGLSRDPRLLGVAVQLVRLWQGARLRTLNAADRSLIEGFHAFEPDNLFRWTNGDAALPTMLFQDIGSTCQVELLLGCTSWYPLFAETARRAAA